MLPAFAHSSLTLRAANSLTKIRIRRKFSVPPVMPLSFCAVISQRAESTGFRDAQFGRLPMVVVRPVLFAGVVVLVTAAAAPAGPFYSINLTNASFQDTSPVVLSSSKD